MAAVSSQRKRLLLAATGGVLAAWAGVLLVVALQRERAAPAVPVAVAPADGPLLGGPLPEGLDGSQAADFTLRDARQDEPIDTRDLRGQPYIVTFLYTDCVDVCPLIASELDQALEHLGREVPVIAVSADPEGDTKIAVRRWFAERDLPGSFRYVIGTEEELRPVWDAYYAAPQPGDREVSAHSASIWLVDGQGRLRSKFSGGIPVPPADIAHDLRVLLDKAA